jgi:hypothetical protein
MAELVIMKLGMYIMAPEPISTVYFINHFHQPVYVYVYPPIVARQRLGRKSYCRNEHISNNRRIVGCVVLYAVRVVSRKVGD